MNIEQEMKFRIDNLTGLEEKILSLGFKFTQEKQQVDHYCSPAYKSFAGTKKYYIRVRQQDNGGSILAFHQAINDLQTEELEVEISDFAVFTAILQRLDCRLDCLVEKKRRSYHGHNLEVVIDQVTDLGSFIELEYLGDESDGDLVKELFTDLVTKLGLDYDNLVIGVGYPDLLMEQVKIDNKKF